MSVYYPRDTMKMKDKVVLFITGLRYENLSPIVAPPSKLRILQKPANDAKICKRLPVL